MLKCILWDVQHGLAVTIITPNNRYIEIDLGTGSYGSNDTIFSPLHNLKLNWNVRKLDCVIFTHPHTDHLDDIFNFHEVAPPTIYRPKHLTDEEVRIGNSSKDRAKIDRYLNISREYNNPVAAGNNLEVPDDWGGVSIKTFLPISCSTSNLNNHSLVTVLSFDGMKILIPGDNEPPSWNELLE